MANALALQQFDPRAYDPSEGPRNQRNLSILAGVSTAGVLGFSIYHIATAVTLSVTATVASMGIALLVIAAIGLGLAMWSYYKDSQDSEAGNIALHQRVINRFDGNDDVEGAAPAPSKSWFSWGSNQDADRPNL